jgi:hypothetical protein
MGPAAAVISTKLAASAVTEASSFWVNEVAVDILAILLLSGPRTIRGHAKVIADAVPNHESGGKLPKTIRGKLNASLTVTK